jgi:predicted amidohydrolase YtcJ
VHSPLEEYDLPALQHTWQRGELRLRVQAMIPWRCLESVRKVGLQAGLGDEWLRVFAIKIFADGALGSRSADLLEPYDDEPPNRGIEVTSNERLNRLVADCSAAGWNMAIHAIGDRANRRVLDALEAHRDEWSRLGLRPRIEHAQLLAPEDMPRLGRLGVVASMQPIHCTSDYVMADRHWGKRCAGAYAWRSVLESGASLAFGSDAPVEEPDVLRGIHAAVTRQRADGTPCGGWHSEQCLSVAQAVHAYTLGAAYACGLERVQGSLSVGKQADMVVLSQDILQRPAQELPNTRVEITVLGGQVVQGAV